MTFSSSGQFLATGTETSDSISRKSEVVLYDLHQKRQMESLGGTVMHYNSLSFSPDGQTLAVAGGACELWSVEKRKIIRKLTVPSDHGHIGCCYIGEDLLATASMTKVYLWQPDTGKRISIIDDGCDLAVVSPDKKLLTTLAQDKAAVVWDISNPQKPVRKWDVPLKSRENSRRHDGVLSTFPFLDFTSDGSVLVSMTVAPASEGYDVMLLVRCWKASDGEELSTFVTRTSNVYHADVDSAGKHFLLSDYEKVHILRLSDGTVQKTYKQDQAVTAISLSPDNKVLAVGHLDGKVDLINLSLD